MNRHQLLLVLFLAANVAPTAFGVERTSAGTAIVDRSDTPAKVSLTGRLARNSADQPEGASYLLLDGWGMIQGYVSPAADLDLQPFLGRQVRIEGRATRHRDGGTPHVTVEALTTGDQKRTASASSRPATVERPVRQVSHYEATEEVQGRTPLTPEPINNGARKLSAPAGGDHLMPYANSEPGYAEGMDDAAIAGAACSTCGECGQRSGDCRCYRCGPSGCLWVRADYLAWWTQGMNTPPLVTSGPSPEQPGYYGATGTQVLFGDALVNGQARSGGRLQVGAWLNPCQTFGVEGEYLALSDEATHFRQWSSGDPILSRPFFDVRSDKNQQNVESVALPRGNSGSVDGSVSVDALTKFQSAGARLRFYVDSEDCCWSNPCCPEQMVHSGWRTDLLLGYRFLRLDDSLGVREELTVTDTTLLREFPSLLFLPAYLIQDQFDTQNQFNGGELGLSIVMHRGCWSLEVIPKVALGSTHEIVTINGSTRTTQTTNVASGGLLALPSNIGQYTANQFAVVPELGLTLGYQVTPRMQLTFGYTFLYWSSVARAGDQIDFKVNPDQLPFSPVPPDPNLLYPKFAFHQTSFWAQGINLGLGYSW